MKTRTKSISKKILYVIATVFLLLFCLFDSVKTGKAFADEASVPVIEQTNVMDDLTGSVIDGVEFSAPMTALTSRTSVSIINFAEYKYSNFVNRRNQYGLYVYVCADASSFLVESSANKIQVAFGDSSSASYAKYSLTYINGSTGTYEGIFHKYRVELTEFQRDTILKTIDSNERVYKISGIEMHKTTGEVVEYGVSKTYRYSGYAQGCGSDPNGESTLSCRLEGLETIDLEVKHANYRGAVENFVCDEINTVYFSVPDKYFEDYGGLQKIKAEWWEYKTKPIFVTSNEDGYNALYDYIGVNIGNGTEALDWRVLYEGVGVNDVVYGYVYNNVNEDRYWSNIFAGHWSYDWENALNVSCMDWLFLRDIENSDDTTKAYKVSDEEIENYMKWYTSKFSWQAKLNGKYAEGLFTDSIDEDRLELLENREDTRGYICQELDAEEPLDLKVEQNQSDWDRFWNGAKYEKIGIDPIIVLDESILTMSATQFGEMYLIGSDQAQTVYDDCVTILKKGENPVLFRFAVTDYYSSTATFEVLDYDDIKKVNGYVAQMTEFLDFDIISLTFRDERGTETVIAVVSDPIDIINGIDPPADMPTKNPKKNWWERFLEWLEKLWQKIKESSLPIIMAIVVVILLLIFAPHLLVAFITLLWKGVKVIIKGLWWLICLPFKDIKALANKKKGKSVKPVKAKSKKK